MIQKLVLDVESQKPIQEYGDGHVLLFNKSANRYYVTTRESLFSVQDAKIQELEQKYNDFITNQVKNNDAFKQLIDKTVTDFTNNMTEKETQFLEKYHDTMASLIEMVKKVVI